MNEHKSTDAESLEVLPPSSSEAIERASIDVQISTAKRYPRSLQAFKTRAIDMACLDEETAESCLYRRPVGMKNGVQQFAEGLSVRMAEIVGACYGNLRVQAQIIEQTPRFVRARGTSIDLESNFASSSEVVESTVKKDGTPYDERMRVVIAKAALAKAKRDSTFAVVPRALAKPIEAAVRKLLMGDTEALTKRREKVVAWIGKLSIDPKRVYAALGIKGDADLGAEQLEQLTGIRTALRDNEVTLDEAFPAPAAPQSIADVLDKKPKDEPKKEPEGVAYTEAQHKALLTEAENLLINAGKSEGAILKASGFKATKLAELTYAQLQQVRDGLVKAEGK
jgi:hypothetical protein